MALHNYYDYYYTHLTGSLLQTDSHASTSVLYRLDALQQCQSTEGNIDRMIVTQKLSQSDSKAD